MSKPQILLDTGILVAALNRRDHFHGWITAELNKIEPPLLTCEAVLSEACFLLRNVYDERLYYDRTSMTLIRDRPSIDLNLQPLE